MDDRSAKNNDLKLGIMDVGVDANHYYPVSLDVIVTLMDLKSKKNNDV